MMSDRRPGLRPLRLILPKQKVAKTCAERNAAYRKKLQEEEPEKWEAYKQYQRQKCREWRQNLTEEQKVDQREKARLRKQASRKRQKEKGKENSPKSNKTKQSSTPTTRAKQEAAEIAKEKKRENDRERQRKCRAKQTKAKKDARNAKRMEYYYRKKVQKNNQKFSINGKPRLKTKSPSYLARLKEAYKALAKKRDPESLCKLEAVKNILMNSEVGTAAKKRYKRPIRVDKTVEEFYEQESINLPGKRSVCRYTMKAKKVLTRRVADLYADFVLKHPQRKISMTTFSRRRPRHILLSSSRAFLQCLCEKCINPMLKMEKLNPLLTVPMTTVEELAESTVCGENLFNRACVDAKCDSCGHSKVIEGWKTELKERLNEEITWFEWKQVGKSKDKIQEKGTVEMLIQALEKDLKGLASHVKTAKWQRTQYNQLRDNIPEGSAVVTIDFAENYLCVHQNEIQSAHWNYKQVSVHPCVLQYKQDQKAITEYKVFLSDDLNHDAAFAKHAMQKGITHLRQKGISKFFIFSDGCSAQYKSKLPFVHLTELAKNNPDMTIMRLFFGSHHGKSLCDSCGGVVKNLATNAVKAGRAYIQNATQMHLYCQTITITENSPEYATKNILRSFELVEKADLDRGISSDTYDTMPGTRKIHAMIPSATVHKQLMTKFLSCFCASCLRGEDGECENATFTGQWTVSSVPMKVATKKQIRNKSSKISNPLPSDAPPHSATSQPPSESVNPESSDMKVATKKQIRNKSSKISNPLPSDAPPHSATSQPPSESVNPESSDTQTERTTSQPPSESPLLKPSNAHNTMRQQPLLVNKREHFVKLQQRLLECSTWETFLDVCKGTLFEDLSVSSLKLDSFKKDRTACLLYPTDAPEMTPIDIYGDGNCLPRSASVLAFGDEDGMTEMRVRIIVEMALHIEEYASNSVSKVIQELPKKAISYSESNNLEVLTPRVILELLKREVMLGVRNTRYMGILELYAVATILQTSIFSIYPQGVGHNVRPDLHHLVHPIRGNTAAKMDYGVMWTHTKGLQADPSRWGPNHFVVCLPPNFGPRLFAGDFVLAKVFHAKGSQKPDLFVAALTSGEITAEDGQTGAWGAYLKKVNNGAWTTHELPKDFFLPMADIVMILDRFNLTQDGRILVYHFLDL